ncbi:MAG: AsmA-like C-terminal region-containing protein [Xanthomonadales bacterium]|nr:AsmA-like C-terminal region-containing protein [Xanthomonadales bacterium]
MPVSATCGSARHGSVRYGSRRDRRATACGSACSRRAPRACRCTATAAGAGRADASRSELALTLVAPRLGDALARLGYASGMADGPLLAEAELVWPGSPLAAALERVSGRLRVRAGPGRLLELEPGAGRILGLVSLDVLPRRLLLDFRDVLAPGMSFTAMRGSFDFANGAARTEDFELLAPGMRILVRGSTDLRARRYDQRVDVVPEVGGALPFLGALAGGAPGAAVGMLARNVLASPLGTIGRAEYRLSGPWERPVLERLVRAPRVSGGGMR